MFLIGLNGDEPVCHQLSHAIVITSNESRPLITCDTPVGYNNRNTCTISTSNGRFDLFGHIRTNDEQIDTLCNKTVYLRTLQFITAVRDTMRESHFGMQQ